MKTVYLFLATGFEEIEALTIVDMLRRAEIDITIGCNSYSMSSFNLKISRYGNGCNIDFGSA